MPSRSGTRGFRRTARSHAPPWPAVPPLPPRRWPGTTVQPCGHVYIDAPVPAPVEGVSVIVSTSNRAVFTATTNCAEFFRSPNEFSPAYPIWVSMTAGTVRRDMASPAYREGGCAACHFDPGRTDVGWARVPDRRFRRSKDWLRRCPRGANCNAAIGACSRSIRRGTELPGHFQSANLRRRSERSRFDRRIVRSGTRAQPTSVRRDRSGCGAGALAVRGLASRGARCGVHRDPDG